MGIWKPATWETDASSGLSRADRRVDTYLTYSPDLLSSVAFAAPADLDAELADAERSVRALQSSQDLAGIARFLLRSEAIASSRIEGIAPSAKNVALAELPGKEGPSRVSDQARLVANNLTVVSEASRTLASTNRVSVEHIVRLHASLLPDEPHLHGLRSSQNWIGGSSRSPIGADFVPPSPGEVPALMADLVQFINGATLSPIVQAALVHAQFETIHPFSDGNGRVGRALIHTVLTRRGLTSGSVLPVSLVLSTLPESYVGALSSFRRDEPGPNEGWFTWVSTFTHAVSAAAAQAHTLASKLMRLREAWSEQLATHRAQRGNIRKVRSDSASAAILRSLPATPVLTPTTAVRIHGVSHPAATKALEELRAAGILSTRKLDERRVAFVADDVLDLLTMSELRLASTQFDTRLSPPQRLVAALPTRD